MIEFKLTEAELEMLGKRFNPSQPRDDDGKWRTGEGGDKPNVQLTGRVSPDERSALIDYAHGYNQEVNKGLRKTGKAPSRYADIVTAIDSLMKKSKVKNDSVVYRLIPGKVAAKLKNGATIRDKAFLSTTKALSVVQGRGSLYGDDDPGNIVVKINVKKGTSAIDINNHRASEFSGERELLINRNQKFKVQRAGKNIVLTTI